MIKRPILSAVYKIIFNWLDDIENHKNIEKYQSIKNLKEFKNSLISFICIGAYNDKTYIEQYMQNQINKGIKQEETIKELIKFSEILEQTSSDLLIEIFWKSLVAAKPSEVMQKKKEIPLH